MSPDVAAAMVAAVAGATATFFWQWINIDKLRRIGWQEDRIERLEKLEALRKKVKKTPAIPPAGPFRTVPIGDPNTTSPLPDPTPPFIQTIYPWDDDLCCPLCNGGNRWMKKGDVPKAMFNSESHTSCNGCDIYAAPHLHVECWNCGFKFAAKGKFEEKEEPEE